MYSALLPCEVLGGAASGHGVVVEGLAHAEVLLSVLPRGLVLDGLELEGEARVALDTRETGARQRQVDADV